MIFLTKESMDFLIKFTDNVEYSENEIDTSFFDTIENTNKNKFKFNN